MSKLKTFMYCDIRNVHKETFDAMVAVAHASGFEIKRDILNYPFLTIDAYSRVHTVKDVNITHYKEISVTDWLFSLAPDHATCMFRMVDTKELKYGDGKNVTYSLDGTANMYHFHNLDGNDPANVLDTLIATREPRNTVETSAGKMETKPERDMVVLKMIDLPLPVHFRGRQEPISPAPPAVQAPRVRLGLFEVVYEDSNVMVLVSEQSGDYYTIMKDWGVTIDQATEADIKIFNQLYRLSVADLNEHHYEALKALHELGE